MCFLKFCKFHRETVVKKSLLHRFFFRWDFEIFRNTYFEEHLRRTASAYLTDSTCVIIKLVSLIVVLKQEYLNKAVSYAWF